VKISEISVKPGFIGGHGRAFCPASCGKPWQAKAGYGKQNEDDIEGKNDKES
jgi:hypothetical protein